MVLLGVKIKGEDKFYLESTQNVIWVGLQKKILRLRELVTVISEK